MISASVFPKFSNRGTYEKDVAVFSSNGKLQQVEYASIAANRGDSVICARSDDGQVLICFTSSWNSELSDDRVALGKLAKVDDSIYFAFSGIAGDGRALLSIAREYCLDYYSQFSTTPTAYAVANKLGEFQHEFSLSGGMVVYFDGIVCNSNGNE